MCLDEFGLKFVPLEKWAVKTKKNVCNGKLSVNRAIVCCALAAYKKTLPRRIKCLEGNAGCGVNGMLWSKHFGNDVEVMINPSRPEDVDIVKENLQLNKLNVTIADENTCVTLRKDNYDFIYVNCNTTASHFFDSIFYRLNDHSLLVLSTSEDPSLYWQSPDVALRNYNGVITKTSYQREFSIRLIIAAMARAAARYNKGLKIHFVIGYKHQQSCTIIASAKKGAMHANESLSKIQRLLHCNICENRKFVPISEFVLESPSTILDCDCKKYAVGKIIIELGPIWSGEIFDIEYIESLLENSKEQPWEKLVKLSLTQILEEARCNSDQMDSPDAKKLKLMESSPYFYFNTHRHSSKEYHLIKVSKIIEILRKHGYRASRTHFDPEAVRTSASLTEYKGAIEKFYSEHCNYKDFNKF